MTFNELWGYSHPRLYDRLLASRPQSATIGFSANSSGIPPGEVHVHCHARNRPRQERVCLARIERERHDGIQATRPVVVVQAVSRVHARAKQFVEGSLCRGAGFARRQLPYAAKLLHATELDSGDHW